MVRSVEVPVDPVTAFQAFTEEIGQRYRPGRYSWNDPTRAVGIRFEPGPGGRLVEVHDLVTGEGYEVGRILVWEPGVRLVMAYRNVHLPPTLRSEVEVRFERVEGGTRVILEHRGLDRLPAADFETWRGRAWLAFMDWYREHVRNRGDRRLRIGAPER